MKNEKKGEGRGRKRSKLMKRRENNRYEQHGGKKREGRKEKRESEAIWKRDEVREAEK